MSRQRLTQNADNAYVVHEVSLKHTLCQNMPNEEIDCIENASIVKV